MRNTAAMLNVTEKGLTVFCVDRFHCSPEKRPMPAGILQ